MKNKNEYMNKYVTEKYKKRRIDIISYLGGACVVCGARHLLEIDHINPNTKEFAIAKRLAGIAEDKLWQEVDKCQLLCRKHHIEKSIREGSFNDIAREMICECDRIFDSIKAYAGHKRWCKE